MRVQAQEPPLRVVRAFELADGAALVHLHNLSGGVLGGDRLEMAVEVGPAARAQLTSTSATRIYRSRGPDLTAQQLNQFWVGENGLLEYLPDQLIPFAGSRYVQKSRIELAPGAGLFWWEIVAPGREASGEIFDYALLQTNLEISVQGKPILLERTRLEPKEAGQKLESLARLGPYRYFASFYVCRVGLPANQWLALESELGELAARLTRPGQSLWGVSSLTAHGLAIRALSLHSKDLSPGLLAFWQATSLCWAARACPGHRFGGAIMPVDPCIAGSCHGGNSMGNC